jgi:phosphoribosylformylglycinamidine cyclo-ligase
MSRVPDAPAFRLGSCVQTPLSEISPLGEKSQKAATYAAAGVDIDAADRLVGRIKELVRTAGRPEVLAGVGPFAGLFRLGQYREPVLVSSTDSVGTKVKLAALMGRYDSVGIDIVNHCVNDILTAGAEPLFFLDYLASSDLGEEEKVAVVRGLVSACRAAGCALIGGETADMPDLYATGDFDLVGFVVGVVERDRILDGSTVREGDVLLGLPSSGLHTNGYSLVRQVFGIGKGGAPEAERAVLDRYYPGLGITLGEALLVPHRCYYQELGPLLGHIKAMAHITGGGIPGNVARIIPDALAARFDKGSWRVPPIFELIQKTGRVSDDEMYRVFNMGLGMVLVCSEESASAVQQSLPEVKAVGRVVRQEGHERVILRRV